MATTKKPALKAVEKEVPAVSAKPAAKKVAAKPAAPKVTAAAKKVAALAAPEAAPKAAAAPVEAEVVAPIAKAPAKSPAKKKAVATVLNAVDPQKRANYIEVAAFYIAERRGFAPGNTEQDYLDAAAEIDGLIAAGHFGK